MSPSLRIENLSVALGGRTIVAVEAMMLEGPGWIGVIGANGSGKTTLLRALGGRLEVAAGAITIDGHACAGDRAARALRIGFAPEIAALPPELTGRDLLSLVARPLTAAIDDPALAPLRAALGLDAFWHRRVGTWSAGMRQRLPVYAAFAGGQRIVILDEPFNWLDPVSSLRPARDRRSGARLASRHHRSPRHRHLHPPVRQRLSARRRPGKAGAGRGGDRRGPRRLPGLRAEAHRRAARAGGPPLAKAQRPGRARGRANLSRSVRRERWPRRSG
jgi:ABC-type branched-subunit amino acid transport system ATPase component